MNVKPQDWYLGLYFLLVVVMAAGFTVYAEYTSRPRQRRRHAR